MIQTDCTRINSMEERTLLVPPEISTFCELLITVLYVFESFHRQARTNMVYGVQAPPHRKISTFNGGISVPRVLFVRFVVSLGFWRERRRMHNTK